MPSSAPSPSSTRPPNPLDSLLRLGVSPQSRHVPTRPMPETVPGGCPMVARVRVLCPRPRARFVAVPSPRPRPRARPRPGRCRPGTCGRSASSGTSSAPCTSPAASAAPTRSPPRPAARSTTGPTRTGVTPNWPHSWRSSTSGGRHDPAHPRRGRRLRPGGGAGRYRGGGLVHPHPRHRHRTRSNRLDGLGHRGVHRPDLCHGGRRAAARQEHRTGDGAAVVADRRPRRRDPAVAGRELGAG